MAVYDLEEQERIDALKDWWAKWGMLVYTAVGAFIAVMLGLQGWHYYQNSQAEQAEVLFKNVQKIAQDAAASKDAKKLAEAANTLTDKFPSSFYATDAQLLSAKTAFEANDFSIARAALQWVIDKGRETHRPIARIRLANVLMEEKKFDEALTVLDGVKEDAFIALAADVKGDIYAQLGRRDEARAAYQLAIDKSETRSPLKALTQVKRDGLGTGMTPTPSASGAPK